MRNGKISDREVVHALIGFINPNKLYAVSYSIDNNGVREYSPCVLRGDELTENHIKEIFITNPCCIFEEAVCKYIKKYAEIDTDD